MIYIVFGVELTGLQILFANTDLNYLCFRYYITKYYISNINKKNNVFFFS